MCVSASGHLASFAFVCVLCVAPFSCGVGLCSRSLVASDHRSSSLVGSSSAFKDEFPEVVRDLHGIVHFQLLSRVFQCVFEFFVVLVDIINSS